MAKSLTMSKSEQLFFPEKTGSGNSGKNPDAKFQTFEVWFEEMTTKYTLLCRIFKVSFSFSPILTFLSKLFLSLYGWFFWINQLICNSWVIWVHKIQWSQKKFFLFEGSIPSVHHGFDQKSYLTKSFLIPK